MALSDPYGSVEEYKQYFGRQSSSDDVELLRVLVAVSRYLDRILSRTLGFQRDGTTECDEVVRYYMPEGSFNPRPGWAESENPWAASGTKRTLDIDDHVSISQIRIDENKDNTYSVTLTASDYQLLPLNAATRPEAEPYRQIQLLETGSQGLWTPGAKVEVTGIGGWPAVPAAIKTACIELAAIVRVESPRATITVNELNQVVNMSPVARRIVSELSAVYDTGRGVLV